MAKFTPPRVNLRASPTPATPPVSMDEAGSPAPGDAVDKPLVADATAPAAPESDAGADVPAAIPTFKVPDPDGGVAAVVRDMVRQAVEDALAAAPPAPQPAGPAPDLQAVCGALWPHVEQRIGEAASRARDGLAAELAAARAEVRAVRAEVASVAGRGGGVPVVRIAQCRKWVQFPPVPLPGGDVSLLLNHDPAGVGGAEIRIPDTGAKVVSFGYRVSIPPGWLADVTVAGIAGQRVYVATLSGSTLPDGELRLALRSNNPHTVQAGHEVARLHLRRSEPAAIRWVDLHGRESDVLWGDESQALAGAGS